MSQGTRTTYPPDAVPASLPGARSGASFGTDFDEVAAAYDESLPAHVVEHYLRKRVAFIQRYTEPGLALDVGCGTGLLARRVAAAGYCVTGLDPSRGMLRRMRDGDPLTSAVVGSGLSLPFADDMFDLTYCVAVLHHVADPDRVRQTLSEMARVTKPGGRVLVWDHNPRNPYWPYLMRRVPQDTGAERLIPEAEIVDALRANGAETVIASPLGMVPDFTPASVLPMVARLEGVIERAPLINRLCAHNVILAEKRARSD